MHLIQSTDAFFQSFFNVNSECFSTADVHKRHLRVNVFHFMERYAYLIFMFNSNYWIFWALFSNKIYRNVSKIMSICELINEIIIRYSFRTYRFLLPFWELTKTTVLFATTEHAEHDTKRSRFLETLDLKIWGSEIDLISLHILKAFY